MSRSNTYYTLLASLPALPPQFETAERVPISSLALTARLKMLTAEDQQVIERIEGFFTWDRHPLDRTDEDVCASYDRFMASCTLPVVREIVQTRMNTRTLVSALRRRRKGLGPPPGVRPFSDTIARNWKHPSFRLGARFPRIAEVDRMLNGDAPFELQRVLLGVAYDTWKRMASNYQFSFEAVILYLARWEIVSRWTSRDAAAGQEKFEKLVTESMGDYANLYT